MDLSSATKNPNMAHIHINSIALLLSYITAMTFSRQVSPSKINRMSCRSEATFKAGGTGFIVKAGSPMLILTKHAPSLSHCARSCIKADGCKSMIYKKKPAIKTEENCQMLKKEKSDLSSNDMEISMGWIYYQPLQQGTSRCPPNKCAAGYKCVEDCTSNGHNCVGLCENGWIFREGYCYKFSSAALSWSQARTKCQSFGADLVTIKDYGESAFIVSRISQVYWIGATDVSVEGTFKWVDGTSLSYAMWCHGEPNDTGSYENCVSVKTCGWNDSTCTLTYRYICKKTP